MKLLLAALLASSAVAQYAPHHDSGPCVDETVQGLVHSVSSNRVTFEPKDVSYRTHDHQQVNLRVRLHSEYTAQADSTIFRYVIEDLDAPEHEASRAKFLSKTGFGLDIPDQCLGHLGFLKDFASASGAIFSADLRYATYYNGDASDPRAIERSAVVPWMSAAGGNFCIVEFWLNGRWTLTAQELQLTSALGKPVNTLHDELLYVGPSCSHCSKDHTTTTAPYTTTPYTTTAPYTTTPHYTTTTPYPTTTTPYATTTTQYPTTTPYTTTEHPTTTPYTTTTQYPTTTPYATTTPHYTTTQYPTTTPYTTTEHPTTTPYTTTTEHPTTTPYTTTEHPTTTPYTTTEHPTTTPYVTTTTQYPTTQPYTTPHPTTGYSTTQPYTPPPGECQDEKHKINYLIKLLADTRIQVIELEKHVNSVTIENEKLREELHECTPTTTTTGYPTTTAYSSTTTDYPSTTTAYSTTTTGYPTTTTTDYPTTTTGYPTTTTGYPTTTTTEHPTTTTEHPTTEPPTCDPSHNLLQNPSFEEPNLNCQPDNPGVYHVEQTHMPGWWLSDAENDVFQVECYGLVGVPSADGVQHLELNGKGPTAISQAVDTSNYIGDVAFLSFAYRERVAAEANKVRVILGQDDSWSVLHDACTIDGVRTATMDETYGSGVITATRSDAWQHVVCRFGVHARTTSIVIESVSPASEDSRVGNLLDRFELRAVPPACAPDLPPHSDGSDGSDGSGGSDSGSIRL